MGAQREGLCPILQVEPAETGDSDCLVSKAIWGRGARLAAHALEASCF